MKLFNRRNITVIVWNLNNGFYKGVNKLVLNKLFIIVFVTLITSGIASAANVDFNNIYGNASEICKNKQIDEDSKSNKDINDINESSKNERCENVKADKDYVEPRFSTKRPRGQ